MSVRRRIAELPETLARSQQRGPWIYASVALVLSALSLPLILGIPGYIDGLTLNSDFTAMLPQTAPSMRDLDEIQRRFAGQQAMTLVVESDDIDAVHRFTRELAPRIERLEEERVVAVDWNISEFTDFVETNRHLYADLADLEAMRDALRERIAYEREHAGPFALDLDDEEPPDTNGAVRQIEREARRERARMERQFPDGFLQHPRRSLVILVVHTSIRGGDAAQVDELIASIRREIDDVGPRNYAPDLEVHWGGTLMEVREETDSLVDAVRNATLLTIAMVMAAIWIFFLRIRPIPLLSLGLIPPVLMTFALAELTVDYLNASSAFLSAIVVGNGINPSIIWLARYFEARRAGENVETALVTSHRGTWKGTLTASLAASVAYVSLMSTDYRGFRDFGIVGGSGMVLCWFATYLLLPGLVVISERWRPLTFKPNSSAKGIYGVLFARLALGWPRTVLVVSALVTIATGAVVAIAVASDPMEYDFRNLRSERDENSDVEYVLNASTGILDDTMSGSALAILAPSRAEAERFRRELEENRDRYPQIYGDVQVIDDLLPKEQDEKIAILRELRTLMLQIRPHVDRRMQRMIDEQLPPQRLRPLRPNDLPRSAARPFTERDGTRGRMIFVEHHPRQNNWDGLYQSRWAEAARSLRLEGRDRSPPVAGVAVVFSDLMETVWRDGPRAVGIAFLAVILLLIATFREQQERWLTLGALLIGILWMAGAMALLGMRLNFLNFVAFPIAFGNGVDYSVNVMRRYADDVERGADRVAAVKDAVEGTGGAVILCSITTTIGYISLHTSSNQALNSFGEATAISEITCLGAAVVALPAALYLIEKRRASRRKRAAKSVPASQT